MCNTAAAIGAIVAAAYAYTTTEDGSFGPSWRWAGFRLEETVATLSAPPGCASTRWRGGAPEPGGDGGAPHGVGAGGACGGRRHYVARHRNAAAAEAAEAAAEAEADKLLLGCL